MVTDEWRPRVGERVRFRVNRIDGLYPGTPCVGTGVVVRNITRNRAEQCDYEVEVEGHGDLCFFRSELAPWTP